MLVVLLAAERWGAKPLKETERERGSAWTSSSATAINYING